MTKHSCKSVRNIHILHVIAEMPQYLLLNSVVLGFDIPIPPVVSFSSFSSLDRLIKPHPLWHMSPIWNNSLLVFISAVTVWVCITQIKHNWLHQHLLDNISCKCSNNSSSTETVLLLTHNKGVFLLADLCCFCLYAASWLLCWLHYRHQMTKHSLWWYTLYGVHRTITY